MEKLLLTRREVAELIGLSPASIEALTKSGQLPIVKIGRAVRVHVDALEAFAAVGTPNKTTDGKTLDALWQGRRAGFGH